MSGGQDLIRAAWFRMPHRVRRWVGRAAVQAFAPRARGSGPPVPDEAPLSVAGLFRTATGLGQGARLCADALERMGRTVERIDLTPALARVDPDVPSPPVTDVTSAGASGALVIHLNPPLVPHARLLIRRTADRKVIGYWAWELPRIPSDWRLGARYVHDIWTPSEFCAQAIRAVVPNRPIHVVPHPVAHPEPANLDRQAFGLPQDAFVVLAMLHQGSGFIRKNPLGAIRAFRTAFGNRRDAVLVLKLVRDVDLPWAEHSLRAALDGCTNIRIIEGTLPASGLAALMAASDALLSLHRAEGFGLVPAEAMRLGKPVVATGWSGNMEFMDAGSACLVGYRLVPVQDPQGLYDQSQEWAEPDEAEAARWLRLLASDRAVREQIGRTAAVHAEARLGMAAYRCAIGCAFSNSPSP
jgi:glycosyltransferase involved in cell wall biosynthesis